MTRSVSQGAIRLGVGSLTSGVKHALDHGAFQRRLTENDELETITRDERDVLGGGCFGHGVL